MKYYRKSHRITVSILRLFEGNITILTEYTLIDAKKLFMLSLTEPVNEKIMLISTVRSKHLEFGGK